MMAEAITDLFASNSSERVAMQANIEILLQVMHVLMSQGRIHDAGEVSAAIAEIERLRAAADGVNVGAANKRVRHVKRGTEYEVLHECAEIQASPDSPLTDYEVCVVYRSLTDGRVWVRRAPEFRDGRFEPVGVNVGVSRYGETHNGTTSTP